MAQILDIPERPGQERPRASRPWQTITFTGSALAGFDDNVMASFGAIDPLVSPRSGYSGFGDAALRFQRNWRSGVFDASGGGYVNSMQYVTVGRNYGADGQARLTSSMGRRHRLRASEFLSDDPGYVPASFAVLRPDVGATPLPDANPLHSSETRRSLSNNSSVDVTSTLSTRNALTTGFRYDSRTFRREFRDQIGDSRTRTASVGYRRTMGRRSDVNVNYAYSNGEFDIPNGQVPVRSHAADVGYGHERRFSSTRGLFVSMGLGVASVQTTRPVGVVSSRGVEKVDFATPTGYASARLSWARTWSLSGDFRRAVSGLAGVSTESFATDATMVRLGGFVQRRTDVSTQVGYSRGQSGGGGLAGFSTYTASSQLRYRVFRRASAIVSHTYYRYVLENVVNLPSGVPNRFGRHSIRVGISVDAPLHRSRNAPPQPAIG